MSRPEHQAPPDIVSFIQLTTFDFKTKKEFEFTIFFFVKFQFYNDDEAKKYSNK